MCTNCIFADFINNISSIISQKNSAAILPEVFQQEYKDFCGYNPDNKEEEMAKDFFMLMVETYGLNPVDLLELRNNQINKVLLEEKGKPIERYTLTVVRQKTKKKVEIPIVFLLTDKAISLLNKMGCIDASKPEARILDSLGDTTKEVTLLNKRHVFVSKINRGLKSISDNLEIKPITCYAAHHTIVNLLVEKELDIRTIQRLLGHQSIKTTEIYLEAFSKDAMKKADETLRDVTNFFDEHIPSNNLLGNQESSG